MIFALRVSENLRNGSLTRKEKRTVQHWEEVWMTKMVRGAREYCLVKVGPGRVGPEPMAASGRPFSRLKFVLV